MKVIEGAKLPIYSWAPDLEEGALRQAVNCANLPVAHHHVAVMADGHQGYGVPVGAVLALEAAISPYAVGNDIGCGMAMVPTGLGRDELQASMRGDPSRGSTRDRIMEQIQARVPAGLGKRGVRAAATASAEIAPLLDDAFQALEEASSLSRLPLTTSQSTDPSKGKALDRDDLIARGVAQAGTLGSGNHFIELLIGPDDDVWIMLHSGSRGVGSLICNNFHRMALAHCEDVRQPLADPGLAFLPIDGGAGGRWVRVGQCYRRALAAGLEYAQHNRRLMLEAIGGIVQELFPGTMRWDDLVNIHHNDATLEEHFGSELWVHRKGAVKAAPGTQTITPGSMGTGSFLGRGLGHPDSFSSCAHGAGRRLSRGRAREKLSLAEELERITRAGGKVFASSTDAVLDEMPAAYKDLDEVMAAQADLVEPVRRFTPFGTYKGAERPRKRKRGRGWRPAEER